MASIMLVAFASRALIPLGFMPASDRPFSIEICWENFPGGMLAHGEHPRADSMGMDPMPAHSMAADSSRDSMHREPLGDSASERGLVRGVPSHHSGSPSHSEHCLFGTACSGGPVPHLPLPIEISFVEQQRAIAFVSIAVAVRLVLLPQPRAPPGRLS